MKATVPCQLMSPKGIIRSSLPFVCAILVVLTLAGPGRAAVEPLSDADVSAAIETEMALDESVPSHLIDVETEAGIVTLSGSVSNILARDRAVHIAESTKGVRSVVNQIVVAPKHRTDEAIYDDVIAALATDAATDSYEIKVKVTEGNVIMEGTVDSWAEKMLAEQEAKGVRGVKEVTNNLSVNFTAERKDTEIAADVKRQLAVDVMIDESLIDVSVTDGKVKLSGTVGSAAESRRAISDAWVNGVKEVDAAFDIEWWARDQYRRKTATYMSDEQIRQAVTDAFVYDPLVSAFEPIVSVNNGVVTLTGTVDSLSAKLAAENTARNTVGVWRVVNLLRVRPEERLSDDEILQRVEDALAWDPYVERFDLAVSVENGKVFLHGTVDTAWEKARAQSVAAGVLGVIDVRNNLRVGTEWTWRDDWEIRQDVVSQLWWSPFVDSDSITIEVEQGVVTLRGSVDTWFERRKAAENAREGGAKYVWNRLEVTNAAPRSW